MCSLGEFIRETDAGVVPVFAWRAWSLADIFDEFSSRLNRAWSFISQIPGDDRIATLRGQESLLWSLNTAAWVPNKVFRADCALAGHVSPSVDCSCGVYALRRRADLVNVIGDRPSQSLIVGQVALWGKMLEYEFGYRAEMAYPAALIRTPELDEAQSEFFQRCTQAYRVPVIGKAEEHRGGVLVSR